MSDMVDHDLDTVADDAWLGERLLNWRDRFPTFMDGHRLFGFGEGNDSVTAQTCLVWFVARMTVRYGQGQHAIITSNLDSLLGTSDMHDWATMATTREVMTLELTLPLAEQCEVERVKLQAEYSKTLMDHELGGTW